MYVQIPWENSIRISNYLGSEAATRGVLCKKVSLEISQNSQESGLRSATLLKEGLAQVFSCEFCEISRNIFFTEQLWTTASVG